MTEAESFGKTSEPGVVAVVVGGRVEASSDASPPEKMDSESFSSAPPSAPKKRAKRGPPVESVPLSAPIELTWSWRQWGAREDGGGLTCSRVAYVNLRTSTIPTSDPVSSTTGRLR